MTPIATLGGDDLPCKFKYTPLIPKKRVHFTETQAGLIKQAATNPVQGFGDIPFTLDAVTPDEAATLCKYYDAGNYTFTGYWGEEYIVDLYEMDVTVRGGYHFIKGKFKVLCTITGYCNPEIC